MNLQGRERRDRNRVDALSQLISGLNFICWIVFLVALAYFHYARPEVDYSIIRHFGLEVRDTWLETETKILKLLLYLCTSVSLLGIILNSFRNKRKTDSQRFNLLLLIVICTCFILVLLKIT